MDGVFKGELGLNVKLIHGICFGNSTFLVIKFKLKQQIDVNALKHQEYFEFQRHYTYQGKNRADTLGCKIRGIRTNEN